MTTMTNEEQITAIQRYITAYNAFDVDAMAALLHPDVIFKNVAGGQVNAQAVGIEQFRQLANDSKKMFSSRQQTATGFKFGSDSVRVDIAYEGVLAVDLPNGMKAGETLRLSGWSAFSFRDGKIFLISDFS